MRKRRWDDIEIINDREVIDARLDSGPQPCMVLAREIKQETIYNLVGRHYLFYVDVEGEERHIVLAGVCKSEPNPEKEMEAFGRHVSEQIFDAPVHIQGIPYMPFCKDLGVDVIDRMRSVFDIREIEYNVENRTAVFCFYYDKNNTVAKEGQVITQFQVQPSMLKIKGE